MAVLSATKDAAETLMADTINAGTMLVEEGALMRESLRFASEPWTPFYMAGENIRESRKASGKQSKYASEANTDHSDEVIDHYNHRATLEAGRRMTRMWASAWSASPSAAA